MKEREGSNLKIPFYNYGRVSMYQDRISTIVGCFFFFFQINTFLLPAVPEPSGETNSLQPGAQEIDPPLLPQSGISLAVKRVVSWP